MLLRIVSLLLLLGAGCATKAPYVKLSEELARQTAIFHSLKIQPIPEPFAFLAVGDVIARPKVEEVRGNNLYITDSFKVLTSPMENIVGYYNPASPDVVNCLVSNVQKEIGTVSQENQSFVLDGTSLISIEGGYGNIALKAEGKVLREKSQQVEFSIPLRYQKPSDVALDSLLQGLQDANYEPLMRGCAGEASDKNFVALRDKISAYLKRAANARVPKRNYT